VTSFEEILAKAAPPELVVPLVVGGDQLNRIRELERELANAGPPVSLADRNPATVIGEQIVALQEEMRGTEVEFKLRAVVGREWGRLHAARPVRTREESTDAFSDRLTAWLCVLVAKTCIEPAMTAEQVGQLAERLPGAAWEKLTDSAWALNYNEVSVPFSKAAYDWTATFEATSRRPPEPESPTASSEAKPDRKPRRTSTAVTEDLRGL
jgi:hypothetical protein